MARLLSIQYLRAFAAFGVVAFHAQGFTYGRTLVIGSAGVDIFFVVSGFVMWTVSAYRTQTPAEFFVNRIVRIVPMYWFVTLSFVAAALVFPALFPRLVVSTTHTLASLFFVPMRSPSNGEIWPVVVPGWTLNCEMFFYAIFALALFLENTRRLLFLAATLFVLILVGRLYTGDSPPIIFYTNPIMLEFPAGILLGRAFEQDRLPRLRWGYVALAAGLLLFAASAWLAIDSPRVAVWGTPAFLVVAGVVIIEKNRSVRLVPVLALLGDASYSIYLTHTLTISAIGKFKAYFNPATFFVASLALSALIGVAAWRLVERPFAEFLKPRPRVQQPHFAE
ncbi:acyltransferase [Bradyrhizobium sp. ISRA443]|uniref:acyltransferase family protein n=1 Tax=unclassified Bradyrhizobium TaxID=2631580 RepID=UPI002479F631|nr:MULTISPECIES: acyltransferase [unclassified Bradyrhizobium]WGR92798.1 acyltransferase [Bradyrhizobium sp. ISRA435]WGR97272.1 acyltransferase [Bradyrhizobium sp. ISRA436]WGS04161.1 acyltransferase [Bradyrhizobium sp. ISRA437]WGS11044.1 acyltransferase [Bradyrhizobium sp. ISRA443]